MQLKMQLNPPPWRQCLAAEIASVVMQAYPAENNDQSMLSDQWLLATQPSAERLAMQQAIPARQIEFARGRHCLRQALIQIGHAPAVIPIGSARQPLLPNGIIGSISHCEDYVVAVCAAQGELLGVGIDVEKNQPLSPDIQRLILTPAEQQQIAHLYASTQLLHQSESAALPQCYWETLIFSIKESFYKALFAVHPHYVDFLQVEVNIVNAQTFSIQPLIMLSKIGQKKHQGCYAVDDHYLYSGISIS